VDELGAQTQLGLLLDLVEQVAKEKHDGHFTVMKFTTEWKAAFGTPSFNEAGVSRVQRVQGYGSLQEALTMLLAHHYKV